MDLSSAIYPLGGALVFTIGLLMLVRRERAKNKHSPFTGKFLRPPGLSLRLEIDRLTEKFDSFALFLVLPLVGFALVEHSLKHGAWGIALTLTAIVVFVVLSKTFRLIHRVKNVRLGYDGEVYTG